MNNTNKIIREIIPVKVRVRKYKVDEENLKKLLRGAKLELGITIKEISTKLNVPKTEVEHWFRNDKCFSVPNEDVWFDLKELLRIKNDSFDKSITTFEIRDGVFDKANRVYDARGIAPTITCTSAENERYKVLNNDLIFVGGIEGRDWANDGKGLSRNYPQGNRVYDKNGISCTLTSQGGGYGSYSGLYKDNEGENGVDMHELIQVGSLEGKHEQSNRIYSDNGVSPTIMAGSRRTCSGGFIAPKIMRNKGENVMWRNELEQFNYEIEEIRLFDSFAGMGALHKALKKLGVPVKLVGISEIEIDAIIAYAGIHIENFDTVGFSYPSDEEMRKLLMDRDIGKDFKTGKSKIPRLKKDKLLKCYKATILLNNLGNVAEIDAKDIPNFDLFNISMPCQTFSVAGQRMGINDFRGTLGFVSLDLLRAKKPKYFMIENVPGLISIDGGNVLKSLLEIACSCGYSIIAEDLNAKNYGIPQNRNRLFVIGVRNELQE